jgi:hypothetical protein
MGLILRSLAEHTFPYSKIGHVRASSFCRAVSRYSKIKGRALFDSSLSGAADREKRARQRKRAMVFRICSKSLSYDFENAIERRRAARMAMKEVQPLIEDAVAYKEMMGEGRQNVLYSLFSGALGVWFLHDILVAGNLLTMIAGAFAIVKGYSFAKKADSLIPEGMDGMVWHAEMVAHELGLAIWKVKNKECEITSQAAPLP